MEENFCGNLIINGLRYLYFTSVSTIGISWAVRNVASIAGPSILADTGVCGTVAFSVSGAISPNSWTSGIFTVRPTPSYVTLARAIDNLTMF